ncbi:MAG: ABC transporter ATP-binding protein/permease [Candidatus Eremiobacteraeota bacterium]|nr:ABC transporter ATP-binding protein/permease [Candidatus Eremiobacteraeota bacterium]
MKGSLPRAERWTVTRRLLDEARPYYPRLVVALVLGLVAGLGPLALTKAFPLVIDGVIENPKHPIGLLLGVIAGVFAVNLISNAATFGQSYLTAWSGQRLIASFRVRLFERTMRMPLAEFDQWRPGELIARFNNDLTLMTDALSVSLPQFFVTLVTLVASLAYMLYIDWLLSLFLFVFAPVVSLIVAGFTRTISTSTKRAQEQIADLSANLTEVLHGERIVKAFGREDYEVARFAHSNERYFGAFMRVLRLGQTQTPIVAMIITTALLAIMAFSAREAMVGRMRPGQIFQFWSLVVLAINPLNRFASFVGDISKGLVGAARIFEVLDLPIEDEAGAASTAGMPIAGALAFEAVTFGYKPQAPAVLRAFSTRIAAGEIVALVGPSGAGKTTIVNLVPRFYEPQDGRITLDGRDLRDYSLPALRGAIAIVPQEPLLFSGTIAANIRYGRLDATRAELEIAAREANAEEFILDLPLGYETTVGERGMRLSGGQRQRISIARAVLRDPRILILDEATSALDSHSERLIEAALDRLLAGRTTMIVAHRLSTIRRANTILYVENGAVLEAGSHDALLARGGAYARLYAAQFV